MQYNYHNATIKKKTKKKSFSYYLNIFKYKYSHHLSLYAGRPLAERGVKGFPSSSW